MAAQTSTAVDHDPSMSPSVWMPTAAEEGSVRPLPVTLIDAGPPSWERIAVGAGLDREGREFSEAETLLADHRAGRC